MKASKACERSSESFYVLSNEPSIALYRIQEHVRRTLPQLVGRRVQIVRDQPAVQNASVNVDYDNAALTAMRKSASTLQNIQTQLKNAMFYAGQIRYQERTKGQSSSTTERSPFLIAKRTLMRSSTIAKETLHSPPSSKSHTDIAKLSFEEPPTRAGSTSGTAEMIASIESDVTQRRLARALKQTDAAMETARDTVAGSSSQPAAPDDKSKQTAQPGEQPPVGFIEQLLSQAKAAATGVRTVAASSAK